MLTSNKVNKENGLKKGGSYKEEDVFKGREFGTELTNTDASSDCTDEKSPVAEVVLESNVPKASYKTNTMSDHYSGTSITNRCVSSPYHFQKLTIYIEKGEQSAFEIPRW